MSAPHVAITAAEFFAASPEQIRAWFPRLEKAFTAVIAHMADDQIKAEDAAKADESERAA